MPPTAAIAFAVTLELPPALAAFAAGVAVIGDTGRRRRGFQRLHASSASRRHTARRRAGSDDGRGRYEHRAERQGLLYTQVYGHLIYHERVVRRIRNAGIATDGAGAG